VKHLCCADSQLSKRSNRSIRVGKTLLNQRVFTMCVWIIDSGQGHATRPAVAGRRTVGILLNQIWSVSGANDRDDVNSTYLTAVPELQPGRRVVCRAAWRRARTGDGRGLDGTPALQRQQGDASRQTAGQFLSRSRSDDRQPGWWA
jgi:hypothetical protein